jgi:glycosyltransferase 2 family protein
MNFGRRSRIAFLKLLTTTLILFLLLRVTAFNLDDFWAIVASIDIRWLVLALPGVILVLAAKSYRWHLLLKREGISYSAWSCLRSYLAAYTLGVVTPGRLGEFVKVYNVRQAGNAAFLPALRTTISDRLYDLVFLCWLGMAGSLIYFYNAGQNQFVIILVTGLVVILFVQLLIRFFMWLSGSPGVLYGDSLLSTVIKDCLQLLSGAMAAITWGLTLLAYFIFFLTSWFLFKALGLPISLIDTAYIITIVSLVMLLPFTIAGFGTRELGMVYLLAYHGVTAEIAISFSLLHFISFFLWGGIVGLPFWLFNQIPLSILREDSKSMFAILRQKTS